LFFWRSQFYEILEVIDFKGTVTNIGKSFLLPFVTMIHTELSEYFFIL